MALQEAIRNYRENYLEFLRSKSSEVEVAKGITRVTLPFLDSFHDCVEIYIKNDGGKYTISDNGETLSTLNFNGVEIFKSEGREKLFCRILNSYGIKFDQNSLFVEATEADLSLKKHMLLQCMMKVSDLYVLNKSNIHNLFLDDVRSFFQKEKIWAVSDHKIQGKSGLPTNFDLVLPKTDKHPKTLIRVVNQLSKSIKQLIFEWEDTKTNVDADEAEVLVIFNDGEKAARSEFINALDKYSIKHVAWSKKEEMMKYAS